MAAGLRQSRKEPKCNVEECRVRSVNVGKGLVESPRAACQASKLRGSSTWALPRLSEQLQGSSKDVGKARQSASFGVGDAG